MICLLSLIRLIACWRTLDAQPSEEIALGDDAHRRFNNEEALMHYLEALNGDSSSYEALWKGARTSSGRNRTSSACVLRRYADCVRTE